MSFITSQKTTNNNKEKGKVQLYKKEEEEQMYSLVIHSFKGGTGKTSFAVNLAQYAVTKGKKVALIDFDLRAPSLHSYFPLQVPAKKMKYFTDYLLGLSSIDDVFFTTDGKKPKWNEPFLISYTSLEFLKQESDLRAKFTSKETKILQKLFKSIQFLEKNKFDLLIVDNMPGITYRSLDALIIATHIIYITRPTKSEIIGLQELANNIYSKLSDDAQLALVINQKENFEGKISTTSQNTGTPMIKDIQEHQKNYEELQNTVKAINKKFAFPILAEIPKIDFLSEKIYLDYFVDDPRLEPLKIALENAYKWIFS